MAVSSYRMIIMVLLLDLILGGVTAFAMSGDANAGNDYGMNNIAIYQNQTRSMTDTFEESANNPNQLQLEQTYGNSWGIGKQVTELFTKGIDVDSNTICSSEDCTLPYIKWIKGGAYFVIILINLIAVIEIFFIIKNKKYS